MSRKMFLGYVPDYSMFYILIGQKDIVHDTFQKKCQQAKWNPKLKSLFSYTTLNCIKNTGDIVLKIWHLLTMWEI